MLISIRSQRSATNIEGNLSRLSFAPHVCLCLGMPFVHGLPTRRSRSLRVPRCAYGPPGVARFSSVLRRYRPFFRAGKFLGDVDCGVDGRSVSRLVAPFDHGERRRMRYRWRLGVPSEDSGRRRDRHRQPGDSCLSVCRSRAFLFVNGIALVTVDAMRLVQHTGGGVWRKRSGRELSEKVTYTVYVMAVRFYVAECSCSCSVQICGRRVVPCVHRPRHLRLLLLRRSILWSPLLGPNGKRHGI